MQEIRQVVEKSPYTMTFACAAKHLCCAPTLPIQPNSNDPAHLQHTCCQCSGVMHGVGFGCSHEFDAIHEKLDKAKLSMNAKSIKHITAETICLLCYTSLAETTGDKLPNVITDTPEEIVIDEESGDRAWDGGTPDPVLGGDETLPKKRPNSVAEKLTLKKKQHANGGESTKHNEFTIQEKLNILEELGANQLTIKSVCLKNGCSISSMKRWKKKQEEWKGEVTKHMGGNPKGYMPMMDKEGQGRVA
jgi:hypothetical protein